MLHALPLALGCRAYAEFSEGMGQALCRMDRAAAAICLVGWLVTCILLRIILLKHKAY